MIYKDAYAGSDCNAYPGNRPNELCVNCGKGWYSHCGWGCVSIWNVSLFRPNIKFSQTVQSNRYLTKSMQTSITATPTIPVPSLGISCNDEPCPITLKSFEDKKNIAAVNSDDPDWKKWRDLNRAKSDCPCGLSREDCSYHK